MTDELPSNNTGNSQQDKQQQDNNQDTDKSTVHYHSYVKCLMCSLGLHEDCVGIQYLSMSGKGTRWAYTNKCECKDAGHPD